MKLLYAPWREEYHEKNEKKMPDDKSCVFCDQPQENTDEKHFIIKRYNYCFVALNLYPYNAGHILVVPYAHKANLYDLTDTERIELIEAISKSSQIIKETLKSEGLNMGINIGKASGGSITNHLHVHIIPRWFGDTNFLVSTADTKQVPYDLKKIYKKLKNSL